MTLEEAAAWVSANCTDETASRLRSRAVAKTLLDELRRLEGVLNMADITMCNNEQCPKKDACYRYIATPNFYRQSYATFIPDANQCCQSYVPVNPQGVRAEARK